MPELPEVETIRRGLESRLHRPTIDAVTVRDRRLRLPVRPASLERLVGQRIERFRRRSKYLLLDTGGGRTLVVHLGMSGTLAVTDPGTAYDPHDHVVVRLRHDGRPLDLRFRDPRRFGLVIDVATRGLSRHRLFASLGPEPLGAEFTDDYLVRVARGRRAPIKAFLMDARVVVGIGNIYASEALWRAGIHPRRAAGRIAAPRLARLHRACREVLHEAIAAGGTTLRDFRDSEGNLGYFAVALSAYDREGRPCSRCGGSIRRMVQSGRATFYCVGCQR